MINILSQTADFKALREQFSGDIIVPGGSTYEARATTFSTKGAPAVIFQPQTAQDIALAISYVTDQNLTVSVRSGGHGMAGFATNNDGAVIDLFHINTIEILDPSKGTVRIGAGAVWEDVARTLTTHQLALSSGDTKSVGVGGLTLGGGIGWMVRKYGLAIDSLIGADIVTADGQILSVDETDHADLFWAVRGGGGNFGVVTHFTFAAHQSTGTVYAGTIQYATDSIERVLIDWRHFMRTASENVTSIVRLSPPRGPAVPASLIVEVCYDGPADEAARSIEPLLKLQGVIASDISDRPYVEFLESARRPPVKIITKGIFLDELDDESITAIATASCKPGSPMMQIRSLGGAMARVPVDATAFAFRKSGVMVASGVALLSDDIAAALRPWDTVARFANGTYGNFTSDPDEDITTIYPQPTLQRLIDVKKRYDPRNLFRQNFNIKP